MHGPGFMFQYHIVVLVLVLCRDKALEAVGGTIILIIPLLVNFTLYFKAFELYLIYFNFMSFI